MTPLNAPGRCRPSPSAGVLAFAALDDVADAADPELDPRRVDAVGRLAVDAEERVAGGRQLDLLLDLAGRVAEEPDLDLLAGLAAGRHDRRRPRERADVQPVLARPVPAVARLPDLHDVLAVRRDHDRAPAVLAGQRGVVADGQLEPLRVEDGDVRVEERGPASRIPSTSTESRWPFLHSTT